MTARSDDPGVSPGTSAAAGGEIWGTWEELLLGCAVRKHGTASWDSVAMEMLSRCPPAAADSLTPAGCRLRFRLLHRRSLQSKVERLKEERERSISGEANPPAVKEDDDEEEPPAGKGSLEEEDDAGVGEDRVSGGESGRSCKESNSSDLKRPRPADDAGGTADAGDGDAAVRGEDEGAGDDASRESSAVKREQASGESVAGSKGTAPVDAEKESSDVQSSASPSRRREPEIAAGEDAEAEEASAPPPPAAVLPAAEAEALRAFLESVRTSKPGSVFERRLESQDDAKYRSTIRRHVDLEMVRSRLDRGAGSYASGTEFYRDLLLLCANALVFYPRGSAEHSAAARTRALVAKHMSKDQPAGPGASKKAKAEADVGSLLEKTAPIIVCRKRSSIAKAASAATAKEEKPETDDKEEREQQKEAVGKRKAAAKDRAARGPRTNKTRGGPAVRKAAKAAAADNGSDSDAPPEEAKKQPAADKKGGGGGAGVAKKRNAVNFLNRMKQGGSAPSTERVSLLETLKLSAQAEQQKAGKGEGKKEPAGGSGSGSKKAPPGRRNIGRPPKRTAAPPSPPPSKRAKGGGGKRGGRK
ncbi:unnamed protein product [Miscanthus lutarioriparius]|uniref:Bromo domain-containing protein n=1 Tax=Miscanthus lutarioriparius TaxID=422564 RepID=A0A811SI24_9POAL|nr:unnamed protein product [Miscanthus lutarioriparius]